MTLPLAGVRVADFTWVGAGPLATRLLALFGAEVIKVESRSKVDGLRLNPPFKDGVPGVDRSGYFADRNPDKKSVSINLKTQRGRELARALVSVSDIVANNFTPGTMERFGLGWDELRELHPELIYLDMSMHGRSGPASSQLGYGETIAATSGLHYLCAADDRPSIGTGTNFPDHIPNPTHSALAVLAALWSRRRTGEGQLVDVAQTEPMISLIGLAFVEQFANGVDPSPGGNRHPTLAPHGVYRCAADAWIAISVADDAEWDRMRTHLDLPRRTEWVTASGRRGHRDPLDRAIDGAVAARDADTLAESLALLGIAAGVVRDAAGVVNHPQLSHREHWARPPHPEMGPSVYNQPPFKLLGTPGGVRAAAPLLGQHTDEVCRDLLGLDDAEIDSLRAQKVLW